ncbi:MAG: hypothetical protein IJ443_05750 [Firmicutes bacterium]|nr:hypothetical protein [Bacillota bacterium]
MKELKRLVKKLNNRMFDVAAAPMFIVVFGVPILLFAIVAGLLVLAFKALAKINWEKKKQKDDGQ